MTNVYTADQQVLIDEYIKFILDPARPVFVINGRPGCGKTFMVKPLIEKTEEITQFLSTLLKDDNTLNVVLTATTNKAAEVLSEKTGIQASTIHSFLGLRVFNDYSTGKSKISTTNSYSIVSNTIVFIDESSMADAELLKFIYKSTVNCKVVFILDKNQVLPVFSSTVPLMDKYNVDVDLKNIVRQAALPNGGVSSIITYAHQLSDAIEAKTKNIPQVPDTPEIIHLSAQDFKQKLIDSFNEPDSEHKYKIVAWTNKRVHKYNAFIRGLKHSTDLIEVGEFLVSNDTYTGVADSVIIKNEEEVYVTDASPVMKYKNTNIDFQYLHVRTKNKVIHKIMRPVDFEQVITLSKAYQKAKNWVLYFELKSDLLDLRPVHACTVHKSQGSTYDSVFIDLDDICSNNKIDEVKRLILVAITRASNKVYVRGAIPNKYL